MSADSSTTTPLGISRLLDHLARHAAERPDDPAIITADAALSWAELAASVDTWARNLRAQQIGRGSAVALGTGRSVHAVTALLSVWAVGATAVLLDERHPIAHLSGVIANSSARWIIAAELTPEMLGNGVPVLTPADLREEHDETDNDTGDGPAPDDVAYVIHTSGSTGRPKGVDVSFANLDAFLRAIETLEMPQGGTGINAVSPAFDGWLWCALLYLVFGNALGIVDLARSTANSPGDAIAALEPRVVCLTPSLLAVCEDGVNSAEAIVVAGEPCPPELAQRHGRDRRLLNVYGPTEATIAATWADSAHGDDLATIGTPIPGYAAHVLGSDSRPVGVGEQGELYIGGPGVALGYRNEPDLTARHFVLDPVHGRLYRTGDLVRQRPDGELEFVGRADTQVKIRGYRVELTEIERRAVACAGVRQAVAYQLPGRQTIGLTVVPAEDYPGDAQLRELLAATLPAHQVPNSIRSQQTLPLTPNGKSDRVALATQSITYSVDDRATDTTDSLLSIIMEVWQTVLEHPVSDVDADFFASGGHSLLASRMISALHRETGVTLSMRELLTNPTMRACADLIRARLREPEPS